MKDRTVRVGVRRASTRSPETPWPRPIASPEPELDGVMDELRQLYELYSDHGDVPGGLADLALRAADAYERMTFADLSEPEAPDARAGAGSPDGSDRRH